MDIYWIRVLSQIGIYATFALYLIVSLRRGPREWIPLVGTILYAVVFEHFNMLRYAHVRGGYTYHPASWLFVWNDVPLYIPLAWAFIVATSRALTDEIVTRKWARPFCDALLALLIDLSLDVIAIRLGFWTWRGIGWNEGFFGVPADNFLGWLLVTFTFCALTRLLWQRPNPSSPREVWGLFAAQMLIVPLCAYGLYLAIEAVVHGGYALLHAHTLQQQLGVLALVLLVFLVAAIAGSQAQERWQQKGPSSLPSNSRLLPSSWQHAELHGPRHIFHIFALIGFFCLPIAARSAPLLLLTFTVWLLELLIAWRVSRGLRQT
jgi:hypothetical protein